MPLPSRPRCHSVVIVDDSRFLRRWLCSVLNEDPRLEVVGQAGNAQEAQVLIREKRPDVLTLDIEMPHMDGLEFLAKVMKDTPLPVVMVSARTHQGSVDTINALALGAVDCVWKPALESRSSARRICDKIVQAAQVAPQEGVTLTKSATAPKKPAPNLDGKLILIGASTGGVAALESTLHQLPYNLPPIVVAQHMPDRFLTSFSQRLDRNLPHRVRLAQDGLHLGDGTVTIAPSDGMQTLVDRKFGRWQILRKVAIPDDRHVPSVDSLFGSAVPWARLTVSVLMTGLGTDGARGMKSLHDLGGHTIIQDEASCVVYGMPKSARDLNAVSVETSLDRFGPAIISGLRQTSKVAP